jgi:predicted lipoprotein with Yx(FWY)xxD motif
MTNPIARRTAALLTSAGVVASLALIPAAAAPAARKAPSLTLKSLNAPSLNRHVLSTPGKRTLYVHPPETAHHLLCTPKDCLSVWKPITVSSSSTKVHLPKGTKGRVTFVKRGKRFQVVLGGRPLYTFVNDTQAGAANGEGVKDFGGSWKAVRVSTTAAAKPAPAPAPPTIPGYPTY